MADAPKPKRVLTEEQKAKMKAGRDAYLARKKAEKAGAPVAPPAPAPAEPKPEKAKRVLTEEQKAKMKAGREAYLARKKAEKAAGAPVPADD
jgi:hypothetical protein